MLFNLLMDGTVQEASSLIPTPVFDHHDFREHGGRGRLGELVMCSDVMWGSGRQNVDTW